MPPTKNAAPARPAVRDDLNDLFDDINDDPFREFSPPRPPATAPVRAGAGFTNSRNNRSAAGLGIDEEVEITKKPRVPRVKLDETRLLSDAGINKLRRTAKDKLKFKGKGHEFSDCARLLSFYQLWLHDLFPKANFADALAMVEKLGHRKTMQTMRMQWINEGKPRDETREDSVFEDPIPEPRERQKSQTAPRIAPIFEPRQSDRTKTPDVAGSIEEEEEDDIYGASPMAKSKTVAPVKSLFGGGGGSNDIPEDHGLDALFNEVENPDAGSMKTAAPVLDPPEDDDLDALFAAEDTTNKASSHPTRAEAHNNFDDDEEAMAEMDMDW